jgi:hypothetical protein
MHSLIAKFRNVRRNCVQYRQVRTICPMHCFAPMNMISIIPPSTPPLSLYLDGKCLTKTNADSLLCLSLDGH